MPAGHDKHNARISCLWRTDGGRLTRRDGVGWCVPAECPSQRTPIPVAMHHSKQIRAPPVLGTAPPIDVYVSLSDGAPPPAPDTDAQGESACACVYRVYTHRGAGKSKCLGTVSTRVLPAHNRTHHLNASRARVYAAAGGLQALVDGGRAHGMEKMPDEAAENLLKTIKLTFGDTC